MSCRRSSTTSGCWATSLSRRHREMEGWRASPGWLRFTREHTIFLVMDDWAARGWMEALGKPRFPPCLLRDCADEGGAGLSREERAFWSAPLSRIVTAAMVSIRIGGVRGEATPPVLSMLHLLLCAFPESRFECLMLAVCSVCMSVCFCCCQERVQLCFLCCVNACANRGDEHA